MPQLVEVRFKGNRKAYFEWHESEPLRQQEAVIVESDRGHDLGLVSATGEIAQKKCDRCAGCALGEDGDSRRRRPEPTRRVLRRASNADRRSHDELRQTEDDVRRKVREKAVAHGLPMKISDTEWQWDRNKLTVYFTADKRIDFRQLVRELASMFRTRIELRQIGVRDEAARLSGIGRCGREYCSASWLTELRPIGLQIAKDQRLSLNPSQISGPCGRLLCCLRYEHEFYVQSRKRFPKEGKVLQTSRGHEKVYAIDIFRDRVTLRAEDGSLRTAELADLKREIELAATGIVAGAPGGIPATEAAREAPPAGESPKRDQPRGRKDARAGGPPQPAPTGRRPEGRPRQRHVPKDDAAAGPPAPPGPETAGDDAAAAEDRNSPKRRRRRRRRRKGPGQGPAPENA